MKPTLLTFCLDDPPEVHVHVKDVAGKTTALPLPASIHAPLRRLLACALAEMGRDLAAAVSPVDETMLATVREAVREDGVARFGIVAAAVAEGGPFSGVKE